MDIEESEKESVSDKIAISMQENESKREEILVNFLAELMVEISIREYNEKKGNKISEV